ncbi:MAG TPA: polysaccharide biosynthesis C-terminal domain-containing protein [Verrucomicrobiae bacterium]|nr:polysaccharide biosynthesis C-terminal domain-containing protein [Verrucomicrobiae bacterium]
MTLGARIARAIFWAQAGRVAEAAIFFLFYLWLARALGPSGYGLFALGASFASVCVFLALLGLGPETFGRFVPEISAGGRRGRARRLLGVLLVARTLAIVAVGGAVFAFRRAIAARFHFSLLLTSLGLVLLLFASRSIFDLLAHFSSGLLDLKRVAAAKLTAAAAAPCLFLPLSMWRVAGVRAAWLAITGGLLAGILILAPLSVSRDASADGDDAALPLGRILAFGMFAWATNLFLYVLGDNTDVLLLGWLLPDRAAIGCYAAGAKIVFSVSTLLLGWVTVSSVASLSEAWQRGGLSRLAEVAEAQWKLAVVSLLAPLLFLICHAREIIAVFYSSGYAASVPVVQILGGLMACAVVCGFSIQGGILYALDRERIACAAVALAAVCNLGGEVLLVRRMGMVGAAWATGLAFVLLAILCTAAGAFYAPLHLPFQFVARVAAAASAGVASTFWLHPDSAGALAAAGLVCCAVFLAGLALLKPLTGADSAGLHRINPSLGFLAERLFVHARSGAKGS